MLTFKAPDTDAPADAALMAGMSEILPEGLRSTQVDSWWRTQSATMALLKHAYARMEEAERKIAEQEKIIRELEDLAATDPLTGLMNRRGFEKFFGHEASRIARKNSPGALLVLIDLDLFKEINDLHGHQAGDNCLTEVAEILLGSIRISDGAARLGGDEFALLLTHAEPGKLAERVQIVRDRLDEISVDFNGACLDFSASIGTAILGDTTDFAAAYDAADKALYADKARRKRK